FLDVSDARFVTGDAHFTFEQWAGALAVANRLVVPQIRQYVIHRLQNALSSLDPFDCIDTALRYHVEQWLFQPVLRICERQEPLSPAEILRLGPERSSSVCRVREKLLAHRNHLEMTWARDKWPQRVQTRPKVCYISVPKPNWVEMSETVGVALATEAKRLIELEPVLTKPTFEGVAPSARPSKDPIPNGVPHPKYWQADSRVLKDIAVSDWDFFLEIVTARPFDEPGLSLPFTSWATGLRLASRFKVESARKYILQTIRSDYPAEDSIDLLEAIKIGGPAQPDWVQYLHAKLSQRPSSLTSQEIRRIGEDATAEVLKLRDTYLLTKGVSSGL
ncbi:hypothetical protein FRC01_002983, partial [Tulasnella sp. 417]